MTATAYSTATATATTTTTTTTIISVDRMIAMGVSDTYNAII